MDKNCCSISKSARRQAIPRSLSRPSKKPIITVRKYMPGGSDAAPQFGMVQSETVLPPCRNASKIAGICKPAHGIQARRIHVNAK